MSKTERELYNVFFFAFLILVLMGVATILLPFGGPLLGAFVMAVTFYPLYERLRRWLPGRSAIFHALIADLLLFIFLVVPALLLIWTIVAESATLAVMLKSWSQTVAQWERGHFAETAPWLGQLRYWMRRTFGISSAEFQATFITRFTEGVSVIAAVGGSFAQNAVSFVIDLLIMQFTLFFLLRDGRTMYKRLADLFPMHDEDTQQLTVTVHDTVVGVVRGWLLTSVVQGLCAIVGYSIAGVGPAVLLGVLTAVFGLLPIVGTFGIWLPLGIFLMVQGMVWQGIFVLIWGAFVVVGFVDTIVRPYLVGQKAQMALLPLFFALLGGVEVFGAKGIILGPLLVAIAPLLLGIYRRRYLHP